MLHVGGNSLQTLRPLRALQSLASLDVSYNLLDSLVVCSCPQSSHQDVLAMVARNPVLASLAVMANPLCEVQKHREEVLTPLLILAWSLLASILTGS